MRSVDQGMINRVNQSWKRLIKALPPRTMAAVLTVTLIGVIGTALLTGSHAATPTAATEAETGTISSGATSITDSTASGNGAVKFGGGTGGGTSTGAKLCTTRDSGGGVPTGTFPAAPCTGYPSGTSLTKVPSQATSGAGWTWVGYAVKPTASNVTLSGLDIDGGIDTSGFSDVTIKNSLIRCESAYINDGCIITGANLTVQDTEIGGGANGSTYVQGDGLKIYSNGVTLTRLNIHHVSDGMKADGGPSTVQDSFIHNLGSDVNGNDHSDGSQSEVGNSPGALTFNRNNMAGGNDCGVFLQSGNTVIITNNYFTSVSGAGGIPSSAVCGNGAAGPITIQNNIFDKTWQAGAIGNLGAGLRTCSGNAYVDGTAYGC